MSIVHRLTSGIFVAIAASALALGGCSGGGAAGKGDGPVAASGLQTVPLTITAGDRVHRFTVEVAASEAEQARGLMGRTELGPNEGMIFPFRQPKFASFWMRNTLIPLDMFFIRADGSIDRIAENTIPNDETPIASGGEVAAVLELAGGSAARLGIDESAIIRWGEGQ